MLATGVAEVLRLEEAFDSPEAAAAFWVEGMSDAGERELTYPGACGAARVARLYPGRGQGTLMYIHGGGWSGGSIALNHRACRLLAAHSGWDVVSVSYRLAPEHPYPAGLEDCRAAYGWLCAQGRALGLNTAKIALGGASAGGNLALALGLALGGGLDGLVLFYPVTGADFDRSSYLSYASGYGLTRARMQALFDLYDPGAARRHVDPLISPLVASDAALRAARLPATCLILAECDVLADDGIAMAARLRDAGVRTDLHVEPGVTHGFINRGRLIPAADACLARAAHFLESLS